MTKYASVFLVCVIVLAAAGQTAEAQEGFGGLLSPALLKSGSHQGGPTYDLFASAEVDFATLLGNIDLSKATDPAATAERVNARRKALYPDAEIMLSFVPPKGVRRPLAGPSPAPEASLVNVVFYWNRSFVKSDYIFYFKTATVAVLFIDDVKATSMKVFDAVTYGAWRLKLTVAAGSAGSTSNYGTLIPRYYWIATGNYSNRADIVMWFYK